MLITVIWLLYIVVLATAIAGLIYLWNSREPEPQDRVLAFVTVLVIGLLIFGVALAIYLTDPLSKAAEVIR
jgi:hypothetical protein